jgi:UDP-N-acetylglucosamine acyltransferase
MGGFARCHQFCKVGAPRVPRQQCGVSRVDVPPYVMAVGAPAKPHSVNAEGLKRRGFTPVQIRNIRNAYRVLYAPGLKLSEAEAQLKARVALEQPRDPSARRVHPAIDARSLVR